MMPPFCGGAQGESYPRPNPDRARLGLSGFPARRPVSQSMLKQASMWTRLPIDGDACYVSPG